MIGRALISFVGLGLLLGCTVQRDIPEQTERMQVAVRLTSGAPLPGPEDPPLALPTAPVSFEIDVRAIGADGQVDTGFQGYVRVSARPGSVVEVRGEGANGRNVLLTRGEASAQTVVVRGARGATRIWVEDIGYVPADPFAPPGCANGRDDDGDGAADYPDDPGCAFANDDTETVGAFAAGVSEPVRFELPRLADVQGRGATTPYEQEGVEVRALGFDPDAPDAPELIVTRIASDGFYVSDIAETGGFGHVFAFTFSTPGGLRVCDRITQLSGTAVEFFGFTELSFPSFELHAWRFPFEGDPGDGPCLVPAPRIIDATMAQDDPLLEGIESALVRVENVSVGAFFGPEPAINNSFGPNKSSCDFDGNGLLDFTPGAKEGSCANTCGDDPQCVEWTGYASRGNYRVVFGDNPDRSIQINTRSVAGFDPPSMRGQPLGSVTGTLRNFSGGSLNWTIEARCADDLVCDDSSQMACVEGPSEPVSSQTACVFPRTIHDPNEATN